MTAIVLAKSRAITMEELAVSIDMKYLLNSLRKLLKAF